MKPTLRPNWPPIRPPPPREEAKSPKPRQTVKEREKGENRGHLLFLPCFIFLWSAVGREREKNKTKKKEKVVIWEYAFIRRLMFDPKACLGWSLLARVTWSRVCSDGEVSTQSLRSCLAILWHPCFPQQVSGQCQRLIDVFRVILTFFLLPVSSENHPLFGEWLNLRPYCEFILEVFLILPPKQSLWKS